MLFLELPIKRYEFCKLKRSANAITGVSTPGRQRQSATRGNDSKHVCTRAGARHPGRCMAGPVAKHGNPSARQAGRRARPRPRVGNTRARWCPRRPAKNQPAGGMWRPAVGTLEAVEIQAREAQFGRRFSASSAPKTLVFLPETHNSAYSVQFCSGSVPPRAVLLRFSMQHARKQGYRRQGGRCMPV